MFILILFITFFFFSIASAETTKALQTVSSITGTLVPDTPMVTTLQYYPHAPTLVQISQTEPTHCKSQVNFYSPLKKLSLQNELLLTGPFFYFLFLFFIFEKSSC